MKRQSIRKAFIIVSFLLFPVTINFLSPYLIITGAAEGIITGSFIVFATLLVCSVVMGRSFCSWICPAAGIQEMCFSINNKKVQGRFADKIKYIIWAPWILGIVFAALSAGGFKKIDFLYLTETGISTDAPMKYITYYGVVALFFIISVTAGKRASCHAICWMAPFMVIGMKIRRLFNIPSLHLEVESNRCVSCKACESKCPMSLRVNDMTLRGNMQNSECILCGECADVCAKKAISYSFGRCKSKH